MARKKGEGGKRKQTPDAPVRRSRRIAEQPNKGYSLASRKAGEGPQRPDRADDPAKVKRTRKPKSLTKKILNHHAATKRQSQQSAQGSQPLPAGQDIERPKSTRLSRAALLQLQRETANDPLPGELQQYKPVLSDESMARGTSKTYEDKAKNVYTPAFLAALKERGVLDQRFASVGHELEKPANYRAIRDAITKDRPDDQPTKAEYKEYTKTAFAAANETDTRVSLYPLFFGPITEMDTPHMRQNDSQWIRHIPIVGEIDDEGSKQQPRPDIAEGLEESEVPRWIRKLLGNTIMPRENLAFPNFLVELKRDKSMYDAHVQNRYCGAVASQAFVEYFVQLNQGPKHAWNVARVGSTEFNGDVIVGNVHWASSSDSSGKDRTIRKYHMARIMCNFTYGLSYEDFVNARQQARNFREYFQASREAFLTESGQQPPQEIDNSRSAGAEEEETTDDDTTVGGPQVTRQPQTNKPAQTNKEQGSIGKRKRQNQTTTKGDGQLSKKAKSGQRERAASSSGHTGLTHETQGCAIVGG